MCPNKTETRLQVTWVYGVTKRGCPKSFGFRHDVGGTGHIAESCGQVSLDIDINVYRFKHGVCHVMMADTYH